MVRGIFNFPIQKSIKMLYKANMKRRQRNRTIAISPQPKQKNSLLNKREKNVNFAKF